MPLNDHAGQLLRPSASPLSTLDLGIGVNWFDFFGSGGTYARWDGYPLSTPAYPPLDDHHSWHLLLNELTRLQPGCIRFGLPPDPIIDSDGRLMKDSVHFQRLDRAAGWCQEHGAVMILDTFVTPRRFEFPAPAKSPLVCINMAAKDNHTYVRDFVVPLLRHVVEERGLKAVRFFNPINEPIHYGVYQTPPDGPDVFRHYVELFAEMRRGLDEAGLGAIGLIGVDKDLPFDFPALEYLARGIDIDPFLSAYSIHSYRGRFDYDGQNALVPESDPLSTLADKWVKRLVRYSEGRKKPLYALEVGVFQYGARAGNPEGPATVEGTLLTAETIIRMINAGVRGALVWSFMNPDTIDGTWGLVRVEDGTVKRAPHSYSTYGMLMQCARPGSRVYPLSPVEREFPAQHIWGTLFAEDDRARSIVLINDHPTESRTVSIEIPPEPAGTAWNTLVKDPRRFGVVAQPVRSTTSSSGATTLNDALGPMSLRVYTTSTVQNLLDDSSG